jgi:2-haloacid dehalogenase
VTARSSGSPAGAPPPIAVRDVVFDLGGVLIDWDPRYLFRDHLAGDPGEVEAFLSEVCTPEWHARLDGGASFAAETRALAERYPQHAHWISRYGADWERMFAGTFAETATCLETLAARGYRLHALSNYPGEHVRFLYRRFPFMRHFETVVLSGLVGSMKPDERIYRYVLERLGGRPCAFVDDRAENVAAACRAGMHAIEFDRRDGVGRLLALLGEDANRSVEIGDSFA